jgi:PEP-CTERM motif
MRRAPAWFVVVGVVCLGFPASARADDGFWVTLAAGASGASAPSDYSEFWFDSPHAPPIAVNSLTGVTAQATTGGGNTFFSGAGTPVLLPTTDGYATLSASGTPFGSGGLPRFAGGTQASGAPQTGVPLGNANLLSVGLSTPAPNGSQVLTVGATDAGGNPLGDGHVTVPGNGWWVVGLGDGPNDTTTGTGTDGDGGVVISTPVPVPTGPTTAPVTAPPAGSGSVTTPEPATVVLLGLGSLCAAGYRRFTRK